MDTSETYIKMCEEAEEIQKLAPASQREILEEHPEQEGLWYVSVTDVWACRNSLYIWIPRQDQLQDMLGSLPQAMIRELGIWYWKNYETYTVSFSSMEQIWLAAIMDWKFNKQWNGNEWVKEL